MNEALKNKIANLPFSPGCYIYKDIDNNVLYVGKAKKLKSRVNQYFDRIYHNKTANLVKRINDLDYIVTLSEKEALVLEINLIKQYNPPFNIIFMDDKKYPYIALTLDPYPRLYITRNIKNSKIKHYGPYPDSKAAYQVINLLNSLYPFVKCEHIPKKECLYYHLGQCLAPCINKVEKSEFDKYLKEVDSFIKGNNDDIIKDITSKMYEASESLNFEKANDYKIILEKIKAVTSNQVIEFKDKINRDVIGFYLSNGLLSISILLFKNGYLNLAINKLIPEVGEISDIIESYLMQFYQIHEIPKEIFISKDINLDSLKESLNINVINPSNSDNEKQIIMAINNAKKYLETNALSFVSSDDDIFYELGKLVGKEKITNIEMCDISHIAGECPIGVFIVFTNGIANKNQYRKYNIKQENSKDDLASTYEITYRRYYNILKDNAKHNEMFIVDGGVNQMNVAKKALSDLGISDVLVCGLAKDEHHKTRVFINQNYEEITLNHDSNIFKFLFKMQEEVHRFAITSFRKKKGKNMTISILDDIKGLGIERKRRLMSIYQSIDDIKKASELELSQVVPLNVAKEIKEKLK